MSDQEHATVRDWTDILARIRFGTVKVAGKNITSARIKAIAGRLANYADSDGSRVRPGLSRLAVDLEIDHGTAKRAVQLLVKVGLLKLVKAGARPGHADEYQLAIPANLLEQVEVWSPARHALEVARVREMTRGRYKQKGGPNSPDPDDLLVPQGPADTTPHRTPAGPTDTSRPVDNSTLLVPQTPADHPRTAEPAGPCGTDIPRPAGPCGTDLLVPQGPATYHGPRHNYDLPTDEEDRTAVPGPRAREAAEPESSTQPAEDPPPLRLIEGNPAAPRTPDSGLWPAPVPDSATPSTRGFGFCLPCHAEGKTTLAADPVNGAACAQHLRSA